MFSVNKQVSHADIRVNYPVPRQNRIAGIVINPQFKRKRRIAALPDPAQPSGIDIIGSGDGRIRFDPMGAVIYGMIFVTYGGKRLRQRFPIDGDHVLDEFVGGAPFHVDLPPGGLPSIDWLQPG